MKSILLVDDEPDTVSIYTMLLEMSGYKVTGVSEGAEALTAIVSVRPDVIVTDWMMPGIDGAKLCEELRSEASEFKNIPIIVISAAMEAPEGAQRLYDRFLRKPITVDELILSIKGLLDGAWQAHAVPD